MCRVILLHRDTSIAAQDPWVATALPANIALVKACAVRIASCRQLREVSFQECDDWGRENYCNSNPRFMWYACRKTCNSCFQPDLQVCYHSCAEALSMHQQHDGVFAGNDCTPTPAISNAC